MSRHGTRVAHGTASSEAPRGWHGPWLRGMDIVLRLAGSHTVVFRCGCLFAQGDDTGVPGWRLCVEHMDLRPLIAAAFGEDQGECVVAFRLSVRLVWSHDAATTFP